jgi:hypothetical protein
MYHQIQLGIRDHVEFNIMKLTLHLVESIFFAFLCCRLFLCFPLFFFLPCCCYAGVLHLVYLLAGLVGGLLPQLF